MEERFTYDLLDCLTGIVEGLDTTGVFAVRGAARNITPGGEPSPVFSLLFDRGFTGHEHMAHFGLINMNGRVYDPVTSTFLSVDNYVQDPSYTQNFNRYAYCMNNPLKYTDPNGVLRVGYERQH